MKTIHHSEHNYDPLFKSLRIEIRFKVWVPKEGKETKFGIIGHDIFLIILGPIIRRLKNLFLKH